MNFLLRKTSDIEKFIKRPVNKVGQDIEKLLSKQHHQPLYIGIDINSIQHIFVVGVGWWYGRHYIEPFCIFIYFTKVMFHGVCNYMRRAVLSESSNERVDGFGKFCLQGKSKPQKMLNPIPRFCFYKMHSKLLVIKRSLNHKWCAEFQLCILP